MSTLVKPTIVEDEDDQDLSPFFTAPHPTALYVTPTMRAAMHKIRYTVRNRQGLTCLLGDVGMGKSSLLRLLHAELSANEKNLVMFEPRPTLKSDFAFLSNICGGLGVKARRNFNAQEQELADFLVERTAEKRNVIIMLDEAQQLKGPHLELIRTLMNYETNEIKLVQIVLCGQIELKDRLTTKEMRALNSRVFAYSVLQPLTLDETKSMIEHRCDFFEIAVNLSDGAIKRIYDITGGVPRHILKLCALAYSFSQMAELDEITADIIDEVAPDVQLSEEKADA